MNKNELENTRMTFQDMKNLEAGGGDSVVVIVKCNLENDQVKGKPEK